MSATEFEKAVAVVNNGLDTLGISLGQLDAACKNAARLGREFTADDLNPYRVGAVGLLGGRTRPAKKKTKKKSG